MDFSSSTRILFPSWMSSKSVCSCFIFLLPNLFFFFNNNFIVPVWVLHTTFAQITMASFAISLQRNYRFFYMFVSTSTILCIYVFVVSWVNIVNILRRKDKLWKAMSGDILSAILIVYCFITFWFVGGLTVFHFYLISTNQVIVLPNCKWASITI